MRMMLGPTQRLQLVATMDIDWFAVRALERPHEYAGRAIALAGDELNFREMAETYRRATGRPRWAPQALPIPALAMRLMPKEETLMAAWIHDHGYEADIASLHQKHPGLLTLEAWIRQRGALAG